MIDWEIAGPVIGMVSFMLISSATILLFPASRRLGHLLELMIQEKNRQAGLAAERIPAARMEELMLRMEARLDRLEDEQRFTAALRDAEPEAVRRLSTPSQA